MNTKTFPQTGSDYGMTLFIEEKRFNIAFTHVGPVTSAMVVYDGRQGHPEACAGRSICHPADTYDQVTGDRLALKRALRIGQRDPWWDGPLGDDTDPLYAQFRHIQREMAKEAKERELETEEW